MISSDSSVAAEQAATGRRAVANYLDPVDGDPDAVLAADADADTDSPDFPASDAELERELALAMAEVDAEVDIEAEVAAPRPALALEAEEVAKPRDPLVYAHEPPLFLISAIVSGLFWLALTVATLGAALLYLLAFGVAWLFAQSAVIARLKGSGVRISAHQFPDLYQRLLHCCHRLGLAKVPDAYLLHDNGGLNALALRFLGRHFVVLHADVVDALADRPDALNFYIGHELGHIRRKHLVHGPLLWPAGVLPLLGAAYARAREYSCDRHGLACCPDADTAARGLAALAAGRERWRTLDLDTYAAQAQATGGFWMAFHELTGDYPWLVKRLLRLREERPALPRRSFPAWLLALLVPRLAGGGSAAFIGVALIGIAAAVAIPAYRDYTVRTQVAVGVATAEDVAKKVEAYYRENGKAPTSPEEAHIDPLPASGEVRAVDIQPGGAVVVTLGVAPVADGRIVMSPSLDEYDSIQWKCMSDLPRRYLPPRCR